MKYLPLILIVLCSCTGNNESVEETQSTVSEPVAYSLSGAPFYEPTRSKEAQTRLEQNLKEAQENIKQDSSELNFIWLGRRLGYLSRYPEALAVYNKGIEKFPVSYRLFRHRGHRYISSRKFDKAIEDFLQAAELMPKDTIETEPDGIPNKINQPLSSTQFNVWYHLGLAYYLKGNYENALEAYEKCMETSVNDDLEVATADWMYMTLKRMGQDDKAQNLLSGITNDMTIIENDSYYKRLLMYKGELNPEQVMAVSDSSADYELALATQGYGVGNYYLMQGDSTKGINILEQVLDGDYWSAFGYIAAEADLNRINN